MAGTWLGLLKADCWYYRDLLSRHYQRGVAFSDPTDMQTTGKSKQVTKILGPVGAQRLRANGEERKFLPGTHYVKET